MFKMLRAMLAGLIALVSLADGRPLHARIEFPPLEFFGVVGEDGTVTSDGTTEYRLKGRSPGIDSISSIDLPANLQFGGASDPRTNQWYNISILGTPASTGAFTYTVTYFGEDGSEVGSGDLSIVIHATAENRAAYNYYRQQQDQSATYADYVYWTTHLNYTFWIGQKNPAFALYNLYTGLGDYYYLITVDQNPQFAAYYYWYYRGLGAYFFYEGNGDLESANLAFAYYVGLANGSL